MAQYLNKTHIEHTLIALCIQFLIWPFLGVLVGGCVAVSIFIGRETAQHEYKLAVQRGWEYGQAMPVKWYEGMTKGWSADSVLDILLPCAACTASPFILIYLDIANF